MVKTMMAWILMGTIQLIHRYLCGHKFITRVAILSLKVVAMRKKKRKKHVLWHPLSQIYRRLKHLSKSLNVCKFSSKLFLSNGSKLSARWLTKKSSQTTKAAIISTQLAQRSQTLRLQSLNSKNQRHIIISPPNRVLVSQKVVNSVVPPPIVD